MYQNRGAQVEACKTILLLLHILASIVPLIAFFREDTRDVGAAAAAADPGSGNPVEVALPKRAALRLGLTAGDLFDIASDPAMTAPRRARVAVVLSGSEHPADVARGDLQIRVHLAALEALTGREDAVDRVIVRLQPDAGAETRERLRDDLRALEVGVDTYTTDELIASTSRTFVVVSRFHRAIAVVTIAASVIFLVTIMALRLTELRREIGALRLIGVSRGTIALMIMLVAGLTVLLGCAAGIGMGALMVWGINAYYRPLFETTLRFALLNTRTVLVAAGLAVLVSLAAGAGVAAQFLRRPALDQVGR